MLGCEVIVIKFLSGRENPPQILLINNVFGLCIASLAVLPVWQMPTSEQWMALAGIGGLMAAAQGCFINAINRADASFVSPFWYATLVFAALYDGIVFQDWPDGISILGAIIIMAGAALLAWREALRR